MGVLILQKFSKKKIDNFIQLEVVLNMGKKNLHKKKILSVCPNQIME